MSVEETELFAPNNHSIFEISYRAVRDSIRREVKDIALAHYPFEEIVPDTIVQVNEAEQASNNFRLEAIAKSGERRTFLLRKNILVADERDLVFLEKTLFFLHSKKVSVPTLTETLSGTYHFARDGFLWQLYEYLPGFHYRGENGELIALAKGVAGLHLAFAQFPYEDEISRRAHALSPWTIEGLEKILTEAKKRSKSDIDAVFNAHSKFLREYAENMLPNAKIISSARRQVIHGDLHPHNTLFYKGKLQAILDFDMMQSSELLRDVGFAAHRAARQYAILSHGGAAAAQEGFSLFLQEYRRHNSLSDNESHTISIFIKDELLRRIVTDFSRYYFSGVERYALAKELEKKIILLKEANLLTYG